MPLNNKQLRVRKFLDILGCMKPFSDLASRERDVFAEYIDGYLSMKDKHPNDEIFKILFHYDFTKDISNKLTSLSGKEVSMDIVRNYTTKLRKKGLLNGKAIEDNFLYLFDNLDNEITFKLLIQD